MTAWDFAAQHPVMAIVLTYIIMAPVRYSYRAYSRYLRHKNIAAHGWPTAPVDADGDVVYPDADDEDDNCDCDAKKRAA